MMELGLTSTLLAGDPRLVDHIVGEVKSQGIFDQFRKECIADVDTKPAYQNLRTRVEGSVNTFLSKQAWKPDLNKNQLRETLRKHIHEAPYLDAGVERIVDQVVNPKVYSVFMPQIEDVVYKFLGIERPKPKEKNGTCNLKDLLPKDLDPVSPESDKNSLKDVSLESMDAMDELVAKDEEKSEVSADRIQENSEDSKEKNKNIQSVNGQDICEDKTLDDSSKSLNKNDSANLNTSAKSDEKGEEDEEDSPTFEPIDIMNLNESNNSNDSQLSGISELTSHRSRSPDFHNELSRDNCDYSNQDSQLSKVSSDSRLSIVTDYGSSNHASTPIPDSLKDESSKDKYAKDNFKAIRDLEHTKIKSTKGSFEVSKSKDSSQDAKESKDLKSVRSSTSSSKENSRDGTDSGSKDKYDHKNSKDKNKDSESSRSKSSKDKTHSKDSKHQKDKDYDRRKSSNGTVKSDKYKSKKEKEKSEQSRESSEKAKENVDTAKDQTIKVKDETIKDSDKKDSTSKEVKDLKDLYKEKIRELREKKELTEKEKLNKDNKEAKSDKESRDKKESSSKDKKSYKKDHKSSSSKTSSSSSHVDSKTSSKSSEKSAESKDKKSDSKEKGKRDEKHPSRDTSRDRKYKNHLTKSESVDKSEKGDSKKTAKVEREEKSEKSESKKDVKSSTEKLDKSKKDGKSQSKGSERTDSRKDGKYDAHSKDKKRREEKKPKPKDDHSSQRRNTNDRRSTDRDGSNGSNGRSSQSNNSSSNAAGKSGSSELTKETSHISNSSIETSDSVEETQMKESKPSSPDFSQETYDEGRTVSELDATTSSLQEPETSEASKKRPVQDAVTGEPKIKKPKFAKNFQEAKKLMKIRKQMEKQKLKENKKVEKKQQPRTEVETHVQSKANDVDDLEKVPDEERVQIIEIPDEEYEEPYPEGHTNLTLEETSIIIVEGQPCASKILPNSIESENKAGNDVNSIVHGLSVKPSEDLTKSEELDENRRTKTGEKEEGDHETEDKAKGSVAVDVVEPKKERTIKEVDVNKEPHNTSEVSKVKETEKVDPGDQRSAKAKKIDETNESQSPNEVLPMESTSRDSEEQEDCLYFDADNEKSTKFSNFLNVLEAEETASLEDMIEIMGGQLVSSASAKPMAPPLPKRKPSTSPLSDILLHNSNNNNDGHKNVESLPGENHSAKKRKLMSKKSRVQGNSCTSQSLPNGENFVMPLSPESDVSATSEKAPSSTLTKEDKGRHRGNQRYSSDDLYKPRPLFSSSSRRSRRSNQA